MSLISEALKKAQQERAAQTRTHPRGVKYPPEASPAQRARERRRGTILWGANIAALLIVGATVFLYTRPASEPREEQAAPSQPQVAAAPTINVPIAAAPAVVAAPSRPSATDGSPFVTVSETPAIAAPSTEYELAGMTAVGPTTLLSITRRSDRRSVWVPVGKSVGEITAVSYDSDSDRAVIRVEGRTLAIRMRDAAPVASPSAQPAE